MSSSIGPTKSYHASTSSRAPSPSERLNGVLGIIGEQLDRLNPQIDKDGSWSVNAYLLRDPETPDSPAQLIRAEDISDRLTKLAGRTIRHVAFGEDNMGTFFGVSRWEGAVSDLNEQVGVDTSATDDMSVLHDTESGPRIDGETPEGVEARQRFLGYKQTSIDAFEKVADLVNRALVTVETTL